MVRFALAQSLLSAAAVVLASPFPFPMGKTSKCSPARATAFVERDIKPCLKKALEGLVGVCFNFFWCMMHKFPNRTIQTSKLKVTCGTSCAGCPEDGYV